MQGDGVAMTMYCAYGEDVMVMGLLLWRCCCCYGDGAAALRMALLLWQKYNCYGVGAVAMGKVWMLK